jgi:hypothetical protein
MDIKIDRVFFSQVQAITAERNKVFNTVAYGPLRTKKPFDLSILQKKRSFSSSFDFWFNAKLENQKKEEQELKEHIDTLLKTPLPLQNFELICGYKSNKTTFQHPIPFWIDGDATAPTNPLMVDSLIYERAKEEIFQVEIPKSGILPVHLMLKGRLLMNQHGYCYLKIKEPYFAHYHQLISRFGGEKPPFLENNAKLGIHVGVIMPKEYEEKKLWGKVREIGKEFYVSINGCYQIALKDHPEYEKLWVIKVDSPKLEELRNRYGLSHLLNGHQFMILVGVKKRVNTPKDQGVYRISPSNHPI